MENELLFVCDCILNLVKDVVNIKCGVLGNCCNCRHSVEFSCIKTLEERTEYKENYNPCKSGDHEYKTDVGDCTETKDDSCDEACDNAVEKVSEPHLELLALCELHGKSESLSSCYIGLCCENVRNKCVGVCLGNSDDCSGNSAD